MTHQLYDLWRDRSRHQRQVCLAGAVHRSDVLKYGTVHDKRGDT